MKLMGKCNFDNRCSQRIDDYRRLTAIDIPINDEIEIQGGSLFVNFDSMIRTRIIMISVIVFFSDLEELKKKIIEIETQFSKLC